ncbi:Holliday junction DNA helicase RuvA [Listeria floridensis FSL S10-1187]|uniref:Holliday junction branch migration complex subunit RuvA n=1 Tax=Listeria floridensis FSL S10-1187 TaxID=1265817 RepID=A0ABN0RF55_9LIST|nr:Holliday junction DNA helicase RuvA [Listeria floridensis FSL S10-1187]
MYDYIKGIITAVTPEYIVVEAGQIGYSIITGNPFSFSALEGQETKVYLYQHVREDNLSLFGFKTTQERYVFKKLLSVSGIGPKSALAIIASGEATKLVQAIEAEDDVYLTKFPSVGKKMARQIILDLKGKLSDSMLDAAAFVPEKKRTYRWFASRLGRSGTRAWGTWLQRPRTEKNCTETGERAAFE